MNDEFFSISIHDGLYEKLKSLENNLNRNVTIVDSTTAENHDNCITKSGVVDHDQYTLKSMDENTLDGIVNGRQRYTKTNHDVVSDSSNTSIETISSRADDDGFNEVIQISDDSTCDDNSLDRSSSTVEIVAEISDYSLDEDYENFKTDATQTSEKTNETDAPASKEETRMPPDASKTANENDIQPSEETSKSSDAAETTNEIGIQPIQPSEETSKSSHVAETTNIDMQSSEGTSKSPGAAKTMNEIDIEPSKEMRSSSRTAEEASENNIQSSDETNKSSETSKKINAIDASVPVETSKPLEISKKTNEIGVGALKETKKWFETSRKATPSVERNVAEFIESFHETIEIDDEDPIMVGTTYLQETRANEANRRLSRKLEDIIILDSNENRESDGECANDYRSSGHQSDSEQLPHCQEIKTELTTPNKTKQSLRKIKTSPKWCSKITSVRSVAEGRKENIVEQPSRPYFVEVNSIKEEDSKPDMSEFKLLDVAVRLPKIDYATIKLSQSDNSNSKILPYSVSLSKFREIETTYFQKKTELYSNNVSFDSVNDKQRHLVDQKRKENIRKRKSAEKSSGFRKRFTKIKRNRTNTNVEKDRTDTRRENGRMDQKIKKKLADRRSLRLRGIKPAKYDLPAAGKIVKNGEDRSKKANKLMCGVKRHLSPHKENVGAKQTKMTKGIRKCGKSSSTTVRKKVSFLLDERDGPAMTDATTPAKRGKDQPRDEREKTLDREKNDLSCSKNVKNSESHTNNVFIADTRPKSSILPIRNYQRTVDAWYECECCHQKYLLLEHIKQHIRSHFPNDLTS